MDPGVPYYKEVYISKSSSNWKEITVCTEGNPSTLQDVETRNKSGGYAYKNHSNRFIYWRTCGDSLELVEESLDVNLCNNQMRYVFPESQVLDWITVQETFNSVVVLVPTLSSVHRLTFPHPHLINKKGSRSGTVYSIFHAASEAEAMSSTNYHAFSNLSGVLVSGASCLTKCNKAVFALSLKNSDITVITMEPGTGNVTTMSLTRTSSVMPRLIYGISSVLMGKEVHGRYVSGSMLLHYVEDNLYLFALDAEGEIRAWSYDSGASTSIQVFNQSTLLRNGSKLCKGQSPEGDLLLCAYYEGEIAVVKVRPSSHGSSSNRSLNFTLHGSRIPTFESVTVVDVMMGEGYEVWCSLTTGQDCPVVTRLDLSTASVNSTPVDSLRQVLLSKPTQFNYPSEIALDPSQIYLDKIMNCGFSSTPDLARTLSALKSERKMLNSCDLRKQISAIVDSEISAETTDLELDDTDFLIVSERLWCRLYRCCVQYLSTGVAVSGLVRLPSTNTLLLIKPHGYSLVRKLTPLELVSYQTSDYRSRILPLPPYANFIMAIKEQKVDRLTDKVELALHLGDFLEQNIEAALGTEACALEFQFVESKQSFDESLYILMKELHAPDDVTKLEESGSGFSSEAGLSAVCMFFQELVSLRLKMCESVCIALRALDPTVAVHNHHYIKLFQEMTTVYKALVWASQTPVQGSNSIVHSFVSAHHSAIARDNLHDTVQLLLHAVWPINNSEVLANHLLHLKRYDLLQMYAHLVDYSSWKLILAECYLASGEPHKALNLFALDNLDLSDHLKAMSLFELYSYPDYVIAFVDNDLTKLVNNLSDADMDTLYSHKFVQELKLGHFASAYGCIDALHSSAKKSDFLLRLVIELINSQRYDLVTKLSFKGMEEELVKILSARSRSLDFSKSQVFYTLLYSIHTRAKDYKKAASVMYEQALRCESSESQWKCFSISYNALRLLPPEDAFIVKPTLSLGQQDVEIVDVEELRKELELAKYRSYLKCSPCDTVDELVSCCVGDKLYSKAIKLSSLFSMDSSLIVEAFTADIIHLADSTSSDYRWLVHIDDDHIEHTISASNAVKVGWRLLERMVQTYEKPCETVLHKAIASQVLRIKHHLPLWLVNSYKKRNVGELLRVYLRFGDLDSASDLAVGYLNAAMGVGCQEFGLSSGVRPSVPALYTPIQTIDLLLRQLKNNKKGLELESTLSDYVEVTKRVTADKLRNTVAA